MRFPSLIIDPRKVLPSRHSIFIRGLAGNIEIDDVKDLFSKESDGRCKVDFFSYSEDKEFLFVAIRFDSHHLAKKMIFKYNEAKLLGQNVEVSWFKDIRKARKRVIENEEKYHDLLVTFDNRRRPFGRFPARRPSMCPRRFGNPPPHRIYRPPFVRQRVSSNNSSGSDSHSSSNSDGNRRSRRLQRRGRSPSSHGRKRRFRREYQLSKPGIRRTQSSSSSSSYSSSSSSSSAPSRRSTTKKPTFQYNTAEAEKEVLQAALEACSTPRERSLSKEDLTLSRGSKSSAPPKSNTSKENDSENSAVEPKAMDTSAVSPPSVSVSPKRKKSKRNKKHSRSHRTGKRKRRDVEIVAYLSESESHEEQRSTTATQPIASVPASEQESHTISVKETTKQPPKQTFSTKLLFDLDEEIVSTMDNEDSAEVNLTELGDKNQQEDEKVSEKEEKENDSMDDQKESYEWIQAAVEPQPNLTVSEPKLSDHTTSRREPGIVINNSEENNQSCSAMGVPEGPALPDDFDSIEPEEPVYIGEGPELPPENTQPAVGLIESVNQSESRKKDNSVTFKSTLHPQEPQSDPVEKQCAMSSASPVVRFNLVNRKSITARRTLLELPKTVVKANTESEEQTNLGTGAPTVQSPTSEQQQCPKHQERQSEVQQQQKQQQGELLLQQQKEQQQQQEQEHRQQQLQLQQYYELHQQQLQQYYQLQQQQQLGQSYQHQQYHQQQQQLEQQWYQYSLAASTQPKSSNEYSQNLPMASAAQTYLAPSSTQQCLDQSFSSAKPAQSSTSPKLEAFQQQVQQQQQQQQQELEQQQETQRQQEQEPLQQHEQEREQQQEQQQLDSQIYLPDEEERCKDEQLPAVEEQSAIQTLPSKESTPRPQELSEEREHQLETQAILPSSFYESSSSEPQPVQSPEQTCQSPIEDGILMDLEDSEQPSEEINSMKDKRVDAGTQTVSSERKSELTETDVLLFHVLSDKELEGIFHKKRSIERTYITECENYTNSVSRLIRRNPDLQERLLQSLREILEERKEESIRELHNYIRQNQA